LIVAEALEFRRLLSALPNPQAVPTDNAIPLVGNIPAGNTSPTGFSPSQISSAYNINDIQFNGTAGDGTGQTIAIVVAYDNPMFVDTGSAGFATSDLHLFDEQYGLPDPPSFTKVDQNGGTQYPGTNPGWANETALDVEWTHALAPRANILLVECSSTNLSNLIESGVQYATQTSGVSVVTMSFAVPEFMGETSYDSFLESPSNHGVTFVAASGDNGNQGGYPAYSPNVVSVGATTLTLSGNSYGSETGRNTSGGGISTYEAKPTYQQSVTQSVSSRTSPDVAFDGDPNTGASVYDSFNGGSSNPWYKVGGTSFSAPAWAALIAIADQGRAQIGLGSLDSASQTLPRLYSISGSDFHDITSGSNGSSAGSGYDLVTGRGTPIADKLVVDLAGGNSVSGTVFVDSNGNGTRDSGENGLANVSVFSDIYGNGVFGGADQQVTSGANGTFDLSDLPGGTYKIAATAPPGYTLTTTNDFTITGTFGSSITGKTFGLKASNNPAKLAFSQVTSTATAGSLITPPVTVEVVDSSGNLVPSDNSMVTLSIASGSATLGGTLTEQAVNGVATFSDLTLSVAGADALKATDGSLTSTTSSSITVQAGSTPPAGSILVFGQQPSNTSAGSVIAPAITVDVESASGNILSSDGSPVTLAIASGSGTLSGSLTVNAVNGVATFSNISIASVGTFTLAASDTTLTPVVSHSFSTLDTPVQLGFTQLPLLANAGQTLSPAITVAVQDGSGNTVSTDQSSVTIAVASGSGTLAGTLTEPAVNGVATFSDLTLSTAGAYTLTATDGLLTAATSGSFTVAVPGSLTPVLLHSTLPKSLVSGSKVHASVVVNAINSAANSSTGTVTTNVFATLGSQQVLLGTIKKKQPVKSKKNYTYSVPITALPSTLNGTYTIQIETIDTAGNTQTIEASTLTVEQPFTSLSEAVTKLTLPTSVVGGAKAHGSAVVKITNSGNVPSTGITTTRLYLSPDGTINSGEVLSEVTRPLSIKANGSVLVTVPITQIPSTLSGSLDVLAEVTDRNAVRTFVNSGSTVTVGAPEVTLNAIFGSITPSTVSAGKSITVVVTIQNNGNVDSTGTATINLGLSSDKTTELPGFTPTARSIRIPTGKSTTLRLKLLVPGSLAAGDYFPFLTFTQPLDSVTAVGTTAVTVS
jgi:subtilase family serine protease